MAYTVFGAAWQQWDSWVAAYQYVEQVVARINDMPDSAEIDRSMDEREFLYDAVDPEFHDLVADLIARLNARLRTLC